MLFTRKSLGDWNYDASELSEEINQVNSHKNAGLTFEGRKLLIERIDDHSCASFVQMHRDERKESTLNSSRPWSLTTRVWA